MVIQAQPLLWQKKFLCQKTYYFDHWQLQVQIVLHLSIILCYSYFWQIIFKLTSLNQIMNYNQISKFNVFKFIFKCKKWFLIFNHTWFLLRILWCSQSDNHPENNLAKFGYIIDMKIRKQTISFYILGYLLEVSIKVWQFGIFKFQKSDKFGPFFPWKILCIGQNHIFQVQIRQKLAR